MKEDGRPYLNSFGVYCAGHVKNETEIPKTPHFAIVVFKSTTEWSPGYDLGDSPTTTSVIQTEYYAFTSEDRWKEAIGIFAIEKIAFVPIVISKVPSIALRAVVDMS